MPYKQVEISSYVRDVLTVREGVDLDRLFKTAHSIEEFENLLVVYAPYLNISLKLFSHIEANRFRRIFPEERNFFEQDTYRVPGNLRWYRNKVNALGEMLEKFVKVLAIRLSKFSLEADIERAIKNLQKTCGILLSAKPRSLSKTVVLDQVSPSLARTQAFSSDMDSVQSPLFAATVLASPKAPDLTLQPVVRASDLFTLKQSGQASFGTVSRQTDLNVTVDAERSSKVPAFAKPREVVPQFVLAPQSFSLGPRSPSLSLNLNATAERQDLLGNVSKPLMPQQYVLPSSARSRTPFSLGQTVAAGLTQSDSVPGSLNLNAAVGFQGLLNGVSATIPRRSVLVSTGPASLEQINIASRQSHLSGGEAIVPTVNHRITQVLVLSQSLQESREKELNNVVSLERQIEQTRYTLLQAQRQQKQEFARVHRSSVQLQGALTVFNKQKEKVFTGALHEATLKAQTASMLEIQKKKHKENIQALKNIYRVKSAIFQRLQTEWRFLQTQHQTNFGRIRELEQQQESTRKEIEQIKVAFSACKQEYLEIKSKNKIAEDALLQARTQIESLNREYKARQQELEWQVQTLLSKKTDMVSAERGIEQLRKIIIEKEAQLKAAETRFQELQVAHRVQIEQLQNEIRTADTAHRIELQKAEQALSTDLLKHTREIQQLKEAHLLAFKSQIEELEKNYKSRVEILQTQCHEKGQLLAKMKSNQSADLQRLNTEFEHSRAELERSLKEKLQDALDLAEQRYQKQSGEQKKLFEEKIALLSKTQEAQDLLQESFKQLQTELGLAKESLLNAQTMQNEQKRILVEVQQENERLQQLIRAFEEQRTNWQRELDSERTQVSISNKELEKAREALQEANVLNNQLQQQLEVTRTPVKTEEQLEANKRVAQIQDKLYEAERTHTLALSNIKQEHESSLVQHEKEIAEVRSLYASKLQLEIEKVETFYKEQKKLLQSQYHAREQEFTTAQEAQRILQLQMQALETQTEVEKTRLSKELQQKFEMEFASIRQSYQEQSAVQKKQCEAQEATILEIKQAQNNLQRSLDQMQSELEVTRKQKRSVEEELDQTKMLVNEQRLALETAQQEKRQEAEDFAKRLKRLQEAFEREKEDLRQGLTVELTTLQNELSKTKMACQEAELAKIQIGRRLAEIEEQLKLKKQERAQSIALVPDASDGIHLQGEGEDIQPGSPSKREKLKVRISELEQRLLEREADIQRLNVINKKYEQVNQEGEQAFESLNSEYEMLQTDYSDLDEKYQALQLKVKEYEARIQEYGKRATGKENAGNGLLNAYTPERQRQKGTGSPLRERNGNMAPSPPLTAF